MAALFFLDPGFAWQERVQPRAVSSSPRTIFLPAKRGNREKECAAIQGGQSAGFRLTQPDRRQRHQHEKRGLRPFTHPARNRWRPVHASIPRMSRLNRRGFVLVPCDCVFCQCLLAVEILSLQLSTVFPDILPGLKWNFPGSFSPGCFWFGSLLFVIENTRVSLFPETLIRPPDQRAMLVPWRHAGCVKPHNGETKYWRPRRSRAGPSVHPHFWHS